MIIGIIFFFFPPRLKLLSLSLPVPLTVHTMSTLRSCRFLITSGSPGSSVSYPGVSYSESGTLDCLKRDNHKLEQVPDITEIKKIKEGKPYTYK